MSVVKITPETGAPRVIRVEGVGPVGPQGPGGALAAAHVHNQVAPAAIWTIDHALGRAPTVVIHDSAGDECEGAVQHPSATQTIITFSAPFAGVARLL